MAGNSPATRSKKDVLLMSSSDLTTSNVVQLFREPNLDKLQIEISATNPEETAARINQQKLDAATPEALFGSGTISGKDFVGRVFRLDSVEWQAGDDKKYTEGLPFYAVLHGVDTNGEVRVIVCGAKSVVRNAAIAADRGWLPRWLKITSTRTSGGYDALDLVAAGADEVPFD